MKNIANTEFKKNTQNTITYPALGFGLGLRIPHYNEIVEKKPPIDWFEILTENYLVDGGKALYYLDKISEYYPIVMHGVSMSLGSTETLDLDYLKKVKNLAARTNAKWISDHLCFTGVMGLNMHDLLPLPYTPETINHVVTKIKQAQDFLGRRILIENVSSYITFNQSQISEWEFLTEITEQSDCLLLLDINNIYVSSFNHGFDPIEFIHGIPAHRVQQMHLAGHQLLDNIIIDTHDHDIIDPVWKLYEQAIQYFNRPISTMIERDDNIPSLSELTQELNHAKKIYLDVKNNRASCYA